MYSIKRARFLFIIFIIFVGAFSVFHYALADTTITDDIYSDTTWTLADSPYIVNTGLYIAPGATLTIEPGVVVKFDGGSMNIFGDIIANGTVDNHITFTSINDDTVGGDTNNDGDSIAPSAGDWDGFYFENSHNSTFEYADFDYADDILDANDSDISLQNVALSNSNGGIMGFNTSSITLDHASIQNITSDALLFFNTGSLSADDVAIDNITEDAVLAYDNSTITLDDSSIQNVAQDGAVSIFNNSSMTADHLDIENISGDWEDAMDIFNGSQLTLNHSTLKKCPGESCIAFYDSDDYLATPSGIDVSNSDFDTGDGSAFITFGESAVNATISHSSIKNFFYLGVESYNSATIHAENNYWGDPSGPYNENQNPDGLGNGVSDDVDFIPFLTSDPFITHTPVIIIPGIMGSYLSKDYDDDSEIWPNILELLLSIPDSFLNDLALNSDGTEDPMKPMRVGDIIRQISTTDTFAGLISELNSNGYIENSDLFVFPYDWRKDIADSAILLKNKINDVLAQTGSDKVDIIAHSMGGLVTKEYIAENGTGSINNLIFIGTPNFGAPEAFKALMYGDGMGIGVPLIGLNPDRIKIISQNMPAVYELLPSQKYITQNGDYLTDARDRNNPPTDLDYDETKSFMISQGRNPTMFPFAESLHNSIDDLDLSAVNTYNFIGCGTKTIGDITTKQKRSWTHLGLTWVEDFDLKYVNGDQTVPLVSADGIVTNNKYFVKDITHADLPSADGLKQDILAILTGQALPDSSDILSDSSACNISGKIVSTHSPVELQIYDNTGNHTGPNPDEDIEYGIPGVQYDILDGEKFAFLPDGQDYKIVTTATDTGGYNFKIEDEDQNDAITNTYNWTLIPLQTMQTNSQIWIGPDYPENNYSVQVDEDGDGIFEKSFPVGFDGTSLAEPPPDTPPPPPVISHSSSGGILAVLSNKLPPIIPTIPISVPTIPVPIIIPKVADALPIAVSKPATKKENALALNVKISKNKIEPIQEVKNTPTIITQTASVPKNTLNGKEVILFIILGALALIIGRKLIK